MNFKDTATDTTNIIASREHTNTSESQREEGGGAQ